MSRFHSHLNTAVRIIEQYKGEIPLAAWLKDFFRQHPQMGSRDRRQVAGAVYAFYRLGHALPSTPVSEKILLGLLLCNPVPQALLQQLKPEWNELAGLSLDEKLHHPEIEKTDFEALHIFPWHKELSKGVELPAFSHSFLQQPDVFLRIRPGHEQSVQKKLQAAGVPYVAHSPVCISLPASTKLDGLLLPDREAVVQDYTSQQTGRSFCTPGMPAALKVWDCCAASGGKSIMAHDLCPVRQLTVSDVRPSILHNLAQRFRQAGIRDYHALVTDLSGPDPMLPAGSFDLLIADVPCSGSGTWSRTPEQLYFFTPDRIQYYRSLQEKIVSSAVKKLEKGGRMVYITCSVFRKENEEMVKFITSKLGLAVASENLLTGYGMRADSMFVAVLEKG